MAFLSFAFSGDHTVCFTIETNVHLDASFPLQRVRATVIIYCHFKHKHIHSFCLLVGLFVCLFYPICDKWFDWQFLRSSSNRAKSMQRLVRLSTTMNLSPLPLGQQKWNWKSNRFVQILYLLETGWNQFLWCSQKWHQGSEIFPP